jgi:CBS domain-containing protein
MKSLVRDLMTTEVVTFQPTTPFKEIVAQLGRHRISGAPVVDADGRLVGIVSEADLLLKEEHPDPDSETALLWTRRRRTEWGKAAAATAGELMTSDPVTVPPTATVGEAARQLHAAGVKRLPVVDERGRLVGICSRRDLLQIFARGDDAIRREIVEEVLAGQLQGGPGDVSVEVADGVVVLGGTLARRSLIPVLLHAVHGVEGVVRVEDRLGFAVDDSDQVMIYPWVGP